MGDEIKDKKVEDEKVPENVDFKSLNDKLDNIEKLTQEDIDLMKKIVARQESVSAETREVVPIRNIDLSEVDRPTKTRSITEVMHLPESLLSDEEIELQKFAEDAYIVSELLKVDPRSLKMWQQFEASQSALKKAMDTATAAEGAEWVPTSLSATLIETFRLQSKVAGLIMDIPMPTNPYDVPFLSGGVTYYYVPESTSDEPSKAPASTVGTGKRTLTAKKIKARLLFSDELSEASIVPVLPAIKEEAGLAGAEALDDIIINGDDSTTHQDSNVTDSKDRRKAWKGLRKLCPAGTKADLSTFDKDTVRGRLTAMGKFALSDPANTLAWLASIKVYNKLRGLTETLTVDKYGPKATILNAEFAKIYGVPIIVSEKIAENLNNTGVYDGSTVDKTIILVFYRRGFMLGTWKLPKIRYKEDDDTDQNTLNISFKKAFVDRYATASNTTIALGYKIS